jgi:hypothetical protein
MSNISVTSGGHSWQMHQLLTENLNVMKYNQRHDWDFKVLISGNGMTRTGKSTITFQMAQYCDPTFADNWKSRVVFNSEQLIDVARKIGKGKVIVYDEARESLDSKKQLEKYTKDLLDFFSQCGNLNHIVFIVLPNYFDLPKGIAIVQSMFLINCTTESHKDSDSILRGYFEFYNRRDKRMLFIKGKMFNDYESQRPSFKGTFSNYIPFDREEYEALKNKSLLEHSNNKKNRGLSSSEVARLKRESEYFHTCLHNMNERGVLQKDMSLCFGVSIKQIQRWLKGENEEVVGIENNNIKIETET